jgi:signal transduction histidine kinase
VSADRFIQDVTQALFIVIFLVVVVKTVKERRRANVDSALLFGATAIIIAITWVDDALNITAGGIALIAVDTLLMALPYFLLRLVDDFAGAPSWLMRAAEVGLAVCFVVLCISSGPHMPVVPILLLVLYFALLSVYDAFAFVREAAHSGGITRRRMRSVALGSLCLGLVLVVAGFEAIFPSSPRWFWGVVSDLLALACALGYFIGFVPPAWLRRAWQEPELRAFLGRAASLPRLPTTDAIVREFEHGAARSLGTPHAAIGLWNESAQVLEFESDVPQSRAALANSIAGRAFDQQRAIFSSNPARDNPVAADRYERYGVRSILAVPISAGDRRLGVIAIYSPRAPIFVEDDLTLAQLLADQAAVILESRALIDEAARVHAREEATRLKDDFLSAAAHDLKTPLTALIAQAQLMERRATRNPQAPADLPGIQRITRESHRLRRLVTELLDVGRVEQGKLLDRREEIDLAALVRESCEFQSAARHPCLLECDGPLTGMYDGLRIRQLVDNLLENAIKYSPEGGAIRVRLWREGDSARLTVTDEGIGIPSGDLSHLFDRFHRGTNVDDRRFAGMGLGLFICRGIAEQHGGRLWATSAGEGQGSTFHVILPVEPAAAPAPPVSAPENGLPDTLLVSPREAT